MSEVRSDQHGAYNRGKSKLHRHIVTTGSVEYHTGSCRSREEVLDSVKFSIHSFTKKDEEDLPPYLFVNCLVEFGCEALLPHYFLPTLQHKRDTYRLVCVGWEGREIFYKDQVDEFWALDSKFNFLRNATRAFMGSSKNLKNIEKALGKLGFVYKSGIIGNYFLKNDCSKCLTIDFSPNVKVCKKCGSEKIRKGILANYKTSKNLYVPMHLNLEEYKYWANNIIKKPTVGIFARGRVTYGRNLTSEFYVRMIESIKAKGYDVIWLGEKESTLPCPVAGIFDFTNSQYADDLGRCLALVSRCAVTFQAWTASTRLSCLTNTPYVLVESPDQLYGKGQEGKRLYLLTQDFSKKRILLNDFSVVKGQQNSFSDYCVHNLFDFLENKNSIDDIGYVSNHEYVKSLVKENLLW